MSPATHVSNVLVGIGVTSYERWSDWRHREWTWDWYAIVDYGGRTARREEDRTGEDRVLEYSAKCVTISTTYKGDDSEIVRKGVVGRSEHLRWAGNQILLWFQKSIFYGSFYESFYKFIVIIIKEYKFIIIIIVKEYKIKVQRTN